MRDSIFVAIIIYTLFLGAISVTIYYQSKISNKRTEEWKQSHLEAKSYRIIVVKEKYKLHSESLLRDGPDYYMKDTNDVVYVVCTSTYLGLEVNSRYKLLIDTYYGYNEIVSYTKQ